MKNLKKNYQIPTVHHHSGSIMQKKFEHYCENSVTVGVDRKLPTIHCLKNGNYAIWSDSCSCNQSAWDEYEVIKGSGWSDPFEIEEKDKKNCWYYYEVLWQKYNNENLKKNPKTRKLKGNYVGFHSWWAGAYGHILHDNLPLLAYLKANINDSFKFLMLNDPIFKNILKVLDEEFYNRVEWIDLGEVISVDGYLIVPTPDRYPCIMAKNLMTYLLEWISISLPKPVKKNNIVFYTRNNTTKCRVLNLENEQLIINNLKQFLIDNKIDGELIIFSGKDKNGKTLSVEEQISIFRSAHTIIGPHGTGLTNIMWCDFDNDTRIKLLEFYPGPNGYSSQVQAEFHGYEKVFRGLPIDYHIILYEPQSTLSETFVDLRDFNQAIEKMFLNK